MKDIYQEVNAAYHKKRKIEFDRQLANTIWLKLKGREIPEHWDEEQIESIITRYWRRAMAFMEGY